MATTSSYMASSKFSMLGWTGLDKKLRNRTQFSMSAQQDAEVQVAVQAEEAEKKQEKVKPQKATTEPRPAEVQVNVQSKNMGLEYGGQWLSTATRHVRIYAAYIDPETWAFDQTQMDKLTLLLDPTNEFTWTPETCNKVYSYFQELVDHYEVRFCFSNHIQVLMVHTYIYTYMCIYRVFLRGHIQDKDDMLIH